MPGLRASPRRFGPGPDSKLAVSAGEVPLLREEDPGAVSSFGDGICRRDGALPAAVWADGGVFAEFDFFACLFCLSLVDLESCIIPDGCLLTAALAWAVWLPFSGLSLTEIGLRVLAAVVYGGGLLLVSLAADKILGKESLGGGDIKLFAVVGLYLGLTASLFALLLSCVLGLVFAFGRKLLPHGQEEHFPFGPSIAAASWLMLMYGQPLVAWYLGLLGLG